MKAKEIADTILKATKKNQANVIATALTGMFKEVADLGAIRHVKTHEALIAIIREQDQKWRAVCRYCEGQVPLDQKYFINSALALLENTPMDATERQIFRAKLANAFKV
jgi:hypothetical protein